MAKHENNGMTASQALHYLSENFATQEVLRSDDELDERYPGGITYVDAEYDERFGAVARQRPLLDRVADGTWCATGYRVPREPSSKPERIPADLWCALDLDAGADTASGGGLEFVAVRFHETLPVAPVPTAAGETHCRDWLVEQMRDPRTRTVQQLRSETGQFDVSGAGFKRALKHAKKQSTTHKTWQTPGPPGSS